MGHLMNTKLYFKRFIMRNVQKLKLCNIYVILSFELLIIHLKLLKTKLKKGSIIEKTR